MTEINVLKERVINLTGYFNVKETYTDLLDYLDNTFKYDHSVLDYDEKNQGGKREINSKIETSRKVGESYKITLKLTINFSGKDTTFENDGKKIQTQKGEGKITINAYIERDPKPGEEKYEKTGFEMLIDRLRWRFVANEDDKDIMKRASQDVAALFDRFKTHFQ